MYWSYVSLALTQIVQERLNYIADALELHLSFANPWIYPIHKLEWAASNGNRYPPYPQVMATAISQ